MALLINERVRLRAMEPEDLDLLYVWENDSTLWESGVTKSPYSRYVLREYISQSHQNIYDLKQLRLMIEDRTCAKTVGIIDLYDFDIHNKRAGVGILVDSNHQGKGVGTEALKLLMEYSFSFLNLHQLYAYIATTNLNSLSLFTKCGFVGAGTLRQWISTESGLTDVVVMQSFADIK